MAAPKGKRGVEAKLVKSIARKDAAKAPSKAAPKPTRQAKAADVLKRANAALKSAPQPEKRGRGRPAKQRSPEELADIKRREKLKAERAKKGLSTRGRFKSEKTVERETALAKKAKERAAEGKSVRGRNRQEGSRRSTQTAKKEVIKKLRENPKEFLKAKDPFRSTKSPLSVPKDLRQMHEDAKALSKAKRPMTPHEARLSQPAGLTHKEPTTEEGVRHFGRHYRGNTEVAFLDAGTAGRKQLKRTFVLGKGKNAKVVDIRRIEKDDGTGQNWKRHLSVRTVTTPKGRMVESVRPHDDPRRTEKTRDIHEKGKGIRTESAIGSKSSWKKGGKKQKQQWFPGHMAHLGPAPTNPSKIAKKGVSAMKGAAFGGRKNDSTQRWDFDIEKPQPAKTTPITRSVYKPKATKKATKK